MTSKLRERHSRLAVWSVRFALLSLPILIIAAVGHRTGRLDAVPTYGAMALGFGLALLAVIAALIAFEAIWRDGRKGAGAAIRGFLLGLLVLSLAGVGVWKAYQYPQLADISTDTDDPPEFVAALGPRAAEGAGDRAPTGAEVALQAEAYPDIVPRHYPVDSIRVFDAAKTIVDNRRWTLLAAERPPDEDQPGRIEATAWTLIFGFRQDVVIRITPDGDGALVDMRSASRSGVHDLGTNAARIHSFFEDLDLALQGIAGEDVEN
jgi:uncharacterized protein (DUF1499 family)